MTSWYAGQIVESLVLHFSSSNRRRPRHELRCAVLRAERAELDTRWVAAPLGFSPRREAWEVPRVGEEDDGKYQKISGGWLHI